MFSDIGHGSSDGLCQQVHTSDWIQIGQPGCYESAAIQYSDQQVFI